MSQAHRQEVEQRITVSAQLALNLNLFKEMENNISQKTEIACFCSSFSISLDINCKLILYRLLSI